MITDWIALYFALLLRKESEISYGKFDFLSEEILVMRLELIFSLFSLGLFRY